jgi:hypothetical protein
MSAAFPTRDELIEALAADLASRNFVLAVWLEGADAHTRVDEYSDIDLWLDVAVGHETSALEAVQAIIERFGPLGLAAEVEHRHPLLRQAFYRLAGAPEFQVIDTCVQSHGREFTFTRGMADEQVVVLFDKVGVVRFQDLDEMALRAALLVRVDHLEREIAIYPTWVRKEMNRGRFLEALGAYHKHVMAPLVEALRLKHAPTKAGFHLKDATDDLPAQVLSRLEQLHVIGDVGDIERSLPMALELMSKTLAELRASLLPVTGGTNRISEGRN